MKLVITSVFLSLVVYFYLSTNITPETQREKLLQEKIETSEKAALSQERIERAKKYTEFKNQSLEIFKYLLIFGSGLSGIYTILLLQNRYIKNLKEARTPNKSGIWAIQRLPDGSLWNPNTNQIIKWTPQGYIIVNDTYTEQSLLIDGRQRMYSIAPPDNKMNANERKLLAGTDYTNRVNKKELPKIIESNMKWADAIEDSTKGQILLGYSNEGNAFWDTNLASQIGIFGANGTGKTTSTAFQIVTTAVKWQWPTIILDPKQGMDFGIFDSFIERHDSDYDTLGPQLQKVLDEVNRRKENQITNPWLLVIEELGTIRVNSKDPLIDGCLDEIMRISRFTGLKIVLIDQRPTEWPKAVSANLKAQVVYKMGLNQGASVGYYKAHELADRGEFAYNKIIYKSWHVEPELDSYLNTYCEPIRSEIVSTVKPTEQLKQKKDLVIEYMQEYPDVTQAELRQKFDLNKSYCNRLYHEYRK